MDVVLALLLAENVQNRGGGLGEGGDGIAAGGKAGGFFFYSLNKGLTRKMDTNNTKRKQEKETPTRKMISLLSPC